MLTSRTVVPPGFPELASDAELAAQLGTALFGALLRLCHLAAPSADVPGGWCTNISADDLAASLGVTRKTCAKWLADLNAAGLIVRVDGKRLGRGLGATPTRYFVTCIPGLTSPDPDPLRPGKISRGKDSRGNNAQVIAYPVKPRVPSPTVANSGHKFPDPVVAVSPMNTQHSGATPRWLTDALSSIGFVGQLPEQIVSQVGAEKLLRLVEAVRDRGGIDSPPRYLNWILRSGPEAIDGFLAGEPLATEQAATPLMDGSQYLALSTRYPKWAQQVLDHATALAADDGAKVDARYILTSAALLPISTEQAGP